MSGQHKRREGVQGPSTFSRLDPAHIRSLLNAQGLLDRANDSGARQQVSGDGGHGSSERRRGDRRRSDRRSLPSTSLDVTRLEHENLYGQVEELVRIVRRLEIQLHEQRDRIVRIESAVDGLTQRRPETM